MNANVPKGSYKKAGEGLFTRACRDTTRGNSFKLEECTYRLHRRKKFFTLRVVRHWKRLPREAVDAPSLAVFTARLDGALSTLVWWKMSLPMAGGLGTRRSFRSFPTQTFYDSMSMDAKPAHVTLPVASSQEAPTKTRHRTPRRQPAGTSPAPRAGHRAGVPCPASAARGEVTAAAEVLPSTFSSARRKPLRCDGATRRGASPRVPRFREPRLSPLPAFHEAGCRSVALHDTRLLFSLESPAFGYLHPFLRERQEAKRLGAIYGYLRPGPYRAPSIAPCRDGDDSAHC